MLLKPCRRSRNNLGLQPDFWVLLACGAHALLCLCRLHGPRAIPKNIHAGEVRGAFAKSRKDLPGPTRKSRTLNPLNPTRASRSLEEAVLNEDTALERRVGEQMSEVGDPQLLRTPARKVGACLKSFDYLLHALRGQFPVPCLLEGSA